MLWVFLTLRWKLSILPIDHDGAASGEEYGSGLLGGGVIEEVEDMQKALKYSSLLSYMLKPSHLLTQSFENSTTAQDKLLKHMCNFGARAKWREGRRVVSSYLDVDTTKYQCRLLDPTPLDCITGYIMQDDVGNRYLKRLPQIRLKFIDGSISSYGSILNALGRLEKIRQAKKLVSVVCDLGYDCMRENEEKKKRETEAEENRRRKYEEKQVMEN